MALNGELVMHVIDEDEVSTETLLGLFRRAYLTVHVDDDGRYPGAHVLAVAQ